MPTVSARQGSLILHAFASLGLDTAALARDAGIRPAQLEEPGARFDQKKYRLLFMLAERASGDPLVGLRAACTSGARGIVSYIALSQPTFGDGLLEFARLSALASDSLQISVHGGGSLSRVELRFTTGPAAQRRHGHEYLAGLCAAHIQENVEGRPTLTEVRFPHAPAAPEEDYVSLLGCPVAFRRAACELLLPTEVLARPYIRANPEVARTLRSGADLELRALHEGDLRSQIDLVLRSGFDTLATDDPESVARKLGIGVRTMQRRLREEGASFRSIRDAVRLDRARRLLADTSLSVSEVAERLGFADVSAFDNAFKRWTGATPGALRARLVEPSAADRGGQPSDRAAPAGRGPTGR